MSQLPSPPPPALHPTRRIAVVGAGIAGATLARVLQRSGAAVVVFDKSRGVGGRLATRRLAWTDAQGRARTVKVDHGAPGFAPQGADFRDWLQSLPSDGALGTWTPRRTTDDEPAPWWLPMPEMPVLCRSLLQGLDLRLSACVERLHRRGAGWRLGVDGAECPEPFDAVLLALPPAQAAPLLAPHRPDWAAQASLVDMQPCWTLMGVSRRPVPEPAWDLARPSRGPLAAVRRDDARPGREAAADEAHWVVHADVAWSRRHLEAAPEWVLDELRAALDAELGQRLAWHHAAVHRWRYAQPPDPGAAAPAWDATLGLGACGDAFGAGGDGVERAWRSAQALAGAVISRPVGA